VSAPEPARPAAAAGRPPALTRSAWALCAASLALSAGTVALAGVNGVSPAAYVNSHQAVGLAFAASFPLLGAMIVGRQPRNWFGWVLVVNGVFLGTFVFTQQYAPLALGLTVRRWSLPGGTLASWLSAWTNLPGIALASTFLILLFPDGHLPSPRWRPLAWVSAAATVGPTAALAALAWPLRGPALVLPTGQAAQQRIDAFGYGFLLATALTVPCVAALVLRFRRSTGVERQQIKWFAYGGLFAVPANLAAQVPVVGPTLELLQVPILFAAIAIAMFRYRLYDVDRLINRTLVYGVVTAILAGGYAVGVLGVGQALGARRHPSSLAVAATTLALAAAFQPLRRRVQDAVDRRFNRHRHDAAMTIAAFSARLRQQVDLDSLTGELLAVVDQTMQPTQLSLWLRPPRGTSRALDGAGATPHPVESGEARLAVGSTET
jgi:hypothetical protein